MPNTYPKKVQPLWEALLFLFIKIIYVIFLYKKFGFILTLPISFFSLFIYHKIIYYLFGLKALSGFDKIFLSTSPVGRYQITSMSRYIKNFDIEKYKHFLRERIVAKIPKFHSRLVNRFMEYYWYEDPDIEKACKFIIQTRPRLKNFEQVLELIGIEINNRIDIFNDFPFQLIIVPYGEDEGVCLWKYDHLLTDGLGIIASLCLISDKFSDDTYPKIMKIMKEPNWLQLTYLYIVSPIYALYTMIKFSLIKERKCPFKANNKPMSNDSKFVLSKKFKLKDFENFRKKNNCSFNDIMMSSFSIAMNKLMKKDIKYKDYKNLIIDLPVGRKKPANSLEKLEIENQASGIIVDMPLINDANEFIKIKNCVRGSFKPEMIFAVAIMADVLGNIFPWQIVSYNASIFNRRFDYMFTNVPGPTHQLTYYGMDVYEIYSFPAAGGGLPYVLILSYNEFFQLMLNSNKNADWDIKDLVYEYEKAIEQFII